MKHILCREWIYLLKILFLTGNDKIYDQQHWEWNDWDQKDRELNNWEWKYREQEDQGSQISGAKRTGVKYPEANIPRNTIWLTVINNILQFFLYIIGAFS